VSELDQVGEYIAQEINELFLKARDATFLAYEPKWDDQIEVLKKVLVKIEEVKGETN